MDRPLMPGQRVWVLVDMWGNAYSPPGRPATVHCRLVNGEDAGRYHVVYADDNPQREATEAFLPRSDLQVVATTIN